MSPRVSVIVPTYNAAPFVEQAVLSVLNQTYRDLELIVVDDGSTDETATILSRYQHALCRVDQSNQGRAHARNAGLKRAKGEYIAFLDADDVWKPDWLRTGVGVLDRKPDISLIHGEVEVIDSDGRLMRKETDRTKKFYQMERKKGSGYLRLLDRCAIFSSTILFRRKCVDEVGLYDPIFFIYEDYDWYLRFSLKFTIQLIEGPPLVQYRIHGGNVAVRYDPDTIAQVYIQILEKQLAQMGEQSHGLDREKTLSRLFAKLAEFHLVRHDKKRARVELLDAFKLDPAVAVEWSWLKRLIFSLW